MRRAFPSVQDTTGTGKDAEDIALKVLQLFHHCQLGHGQALVGASSAIVPSDAFDGLVGYQVNLNTFGGPVAETVVATPTASARNDRRNKIFRLRALLKTSGKIGDVVVGFEQEGKIGRRLKR
jgi:hypothetical protein